MLLEEVIRAELAELFPGQRVLASAAFRIARDAEIELDDEGGRPYLETVEEILPRMKVLTMDRQGGRSPVDLNLLPRSPATAAPPGPGAPGAGNAPEPAAPPTGTP